MATRHELNGTTLYDARGNRQCKDAQPLDYVLYDDGIWQFRGDGRRLRLYRVLSNTAVDVARVIADMRAGQ